MGSCKLSGAKHDAACLLTKADWSDRRIAEVFDLAIITVKQWRKRNGFKRPSGQKIDNAGAMQMYRAGASDQEIGARYGATQSGATRWRWRHHLPPNHEPKRLTEEKCRALRMMLRKGATRRQIHDAIGVGEASVRKFRKMMRGDARLRQSGHFLKRTPPEALLDLQDRIADAIGRRRPPHLVEEARDEMNVDLLDGLLEPHQIEERARWYVNQVLDGSAASKFGPVSLDEELGEDGFTRADLLSDPAAESWLERCGA